MRTFLIDRSDVQGLDRTSFQFLSDAKNFSFRFSISNRSLAMVVWPLPLEKVLEDDEAVVVFSNPGLCDDFDEDGE